MAFLVTMTDLGIYDFTIKCLLILDFVISALFNSFFPKILSKTAGEKVAKTSIEINRYYNGLTAAIMIMVCGAILTLPVAITLLVKKPGYGDSIYLIPFASLVFLLRGMRFYFGLPYSVMKYNKPFPIIFLIVSSAKVVLSILLIQRFGIYGAIGATIGSSSLEILLVWLWMKDRFSYTFNPYKLIVAPLTLLATILLLEPWLGRTYPIPVHLGYAMLTAISLVWLYRNELPLLNLNKVLKG
jgi:O-antigen/teichoic acid export membrane protein